MMTTKTHGVGFFPHDFIHKKIAEPDIDLIGEPQNGVSARND